MNKTKQNRCSLCSRYMPRGYLLATDAKSESSICKWCLMAIQNSGCHPKEVAKVTDEEF